MANVPTRSPTSRMNLGRTMRNNKLLFVSKTEIYNMKNANGTTKLTYLANSSEPNWESLVKKLTIEPLKREKASKKMEKPMNGTSNVQPKKPWSRCSSSLKKG